MLKSLLLGQVLRLNGCRGLCYTGMRYKIIKAMSHDAREHGLEVLDLRNTRYAADAWLSDSLGPALRELYICPAW